MTVVSTFKKMKRYLNMKWIVPSLLVLFLASAVEAGILGEGVQTSCDPDTTYVMGDDFNIDDVRCSGDAVVMDSFTVLIYANQSYVDVELDNVESNNLNFTETPASSAYITHNVTGAFSPSEFLGIYRDSVLLERTNADLSGSLDWFNESLFFSGSQEWLFVPVTTTTTTTTTTTSTTGTSIPGGSGTGTGPSPPIYDEMNLTITLSPTWVFQESTNKLKAKIEATQPYYDFNMWVALEDQLFYLNYSQPGGYVEYILGEFTAPKQNVTMTVTFTYRDVYGDIINKTTNQSLFVFTPKTEAGRAKPFDVFAVVISILAVSRKLILRTSGET